MRGFIVSDDAVAEQPRKISIRPSLGSLPGVVVECDGLTLIEFAVSGRVTLFSHSKEQFETRGLPCRRELIAGNHWKITVG